LELPEQAANIPGPDSYVRVFLEKQDNGTKLSLSQYSAGGGGERTGDVCRRRWHTLLNQDLKLFVEKGIPYQHNS
jgi:hypothetical protein